MNRKVKQLAIAMPAAIMLTACADDGYEKETWVTSVKNSQLENPSEISISKTSTSDSTKTVVFSWPVVHGAGGYLMSIVNISDPANPVNVVTDSLIDRCSVAMELPNEETYNFCLTSAANTKYGNKQATEASVTKFDTYVPSVEIPAGTELSAWIADNLTYSDEEQGFLLTAGETYTLDGALDFGLNTVEFRGDKNNAPTIIVGENGYITTQGGLKIRDLNIDCTNATYGGLLALGATPDSTISTQSLGYKNIGGNQDGFVIQKAVAFQNCKIKNLPKALLWDSEQNWTLLDFRVVDCLIQMNGTTSSPTINFYHGSGNGLIQKLTVSNSTFFSSVRNEAESYFIRFTNASNAQPRKVLGDANNFLEWTFENSSFIRTNPKKDFANNIPNTQNDNKLWIKITDCVFFDVYRLYQGLATQWIKTTTGNFMSYSDFCSATSTDYGPDGRTDKDGNFYTTRDEEAEFQESQLQELDFTQPLGGVNLAPSGLAAEAKSGDPRWFE
ncbi:MAG: DUF4957 domain-containing protein [Bacteroidales bacterium]|jgi:hypothetical protein|nr:DUF4957 domain-containing protein [Bacteroidales bacterium]